MGSKELFLNNLDDWDFYKDNHLTIAEHKVLQLKFLIDYDLVHKLDNKQFLFKLNDIEVSLVRTRLVKSVKEHEDYDKAEVDEMLSEYYNPAKCSFCNGSVDNQGRGNRFILHVGYGSKLDGENRETILCDNCLESYTDEYIIKK